MKDFDNLKNSLSLKDRRIIDLENEINSLKKNNENFIKYKSERETLILENAKMESEMKKLKYEIEECKSLVERQNIILKSKEEMLSKMTEEVNYLTFNAKKYKQEADRSLQDAIAYQQIVRKMEKDMAECQHKKEKIENELIIIKQQIFKK
jgi:hypothetical protein